MMKKLINFFAIALCVFFAKDAVAQSSEPIRASVTKLSCHMTIAPSEDIKALNEQYKKKLFFTAEETEAMKKMAEDACAKKELIFDSFDDDKNINCTGSYTGVATDTLEAVNTMLRGQVFISKKYGNTNTGSWENDDDARIFNRAGNKVRHIAKKLCKTVSNDFDRGEFI
jgi:hypothetical protein